MSVVSILTLLSGVALFLYGMSIMGDSLKKVAGNKLELILYKLTNTPLKGILLGTGATALIQSSSATTIMTVGFVNSGLMQVSQAIAIIIGANIGTSITGWILCLSYIEGTSGLSQILSTATISAVVAIVGIVIRMVNRRDSSKAVGDILLGFAILMLGMQTMSAAVAPLKESPLFMKSIVWLENPAAAILVGILMTAVLQSSSASVGILQALSITGAIDFGIAFPMIMGISVGSALPVMLSAIGSNKNGKRTALVYLLYGLFGLTVCSAVFYPLNAVFRFGFVNAAMSPVRIAMLNTGFRLVTALILAPFIPQIEKLVFWLIKDSAEEKEDQADFDLLDERFLNYPALAISQSHTAMNGMAKKSRKNLMRSLQLLDQYSEKKWKKVQQKENVIDKYEDKLGTYLLKLTGKDMTEAQTREVTKFLHTISDFERIGDHAVNISNTAKELYEKDLSFTDEAKYELEILRTAVREITKLTVTAFTEDNLNIAVMVEPLREHIGVMCDELKLRHIDRLQQGKCGVVQGFIFNDLLNNLERVADHCSNIAVAMIELESSDFDTHQYQKSVKKKKDAQYRTLLEGFERKYDINHYVPIVDPEETAEEIELEQEDTQAKSGIAWLAEAISERSRPDSDEEGDEPQENADEGKPDEAEDAAANAEAGGTAVSPDEQEAAGEEPAAEERTSEERTSEEEPADDSDGQASAPENEFAENGQKNP